MARQPKLPTGMTPDVRKAYDRWLLQNPLDIWMKMGDGEHKYDQAEVAVMLSCSQPSISQWRSGWKLPPTQYLIEMAKMTGEEPGAFQKRWHSWYHRPPPGTRDNRKPSKSADWNPIYIAWLQRNPLAKWRAAEKLSVQQAAAVFQVTYNRLLDWTHGNRMPSPQIMEEMAEKMKAPFKELLEEWNNWLHSNPYGTRPQKLDSILNNYQRKLMKTHGLTIEDVLERDRRIDHQRYLQLEANIKFYKKRGWPVPEDWEKKLRGEI